LFLQNNDWLGGPTPACYHRRRALFLHLLPGHRYCQSLSPPCRWLPPPFPYPPPTRTHSGWPVCTQLTKTVVMAVERRMRGGCADHGAAGIKLLPLPTTSWRNDENTAGAPQGGNEAKKERYRARSGKRGQNWGKKSKDDEVVSGVGGRRGGKAGWGIGGVLQEERRGSARVVVVTECNARRRAFRAGADRWRWGPQDKRPRAVRSAEKDRCVEETSSPQERLGGQRTWIRPPPSLKNDWSDDAGGLFVEQIHSLIGSTQVD